ncbi:hypothetical protein F5Y15DRAFT_110405 [Xylariaceae sp. FL0016]|nr:hypothetical protein F5Y15DRAFT_110405 [Xylariaceae sp. FL0016]
MCRVVRVCVAAAFLATWRAWVCLSGRLSVFPTLLYPTVNKAYLLSATLPFPVPISFSLLFSHIFSNPFLSSCLSLHRLNSPFYPAGRTPILANISRSSGLSEISIDEGAAEKLMSHAAHEPDRGWLNHDGWATLPADVAQTGHGQRRIFIHYQDVLH